jgi:hypothetical protein
MSAPCLYIKTLTDDCSIERKRHFGRSRVTKFNSFIFSLVSAVAADSRKIKAR